MSKAPVVYSIFAVAFVAGLWGILAFGSRHLTAPRDIGGTWKVLPGSPHAPGGEIRLEQSGRFVELTLPNQPAISLMLQEEESGDIVLTGNGWTTRLQQTGGSGDCEFQMKGPRNYEFHAHRQDPGASAETHSGD